MTNNESAKLNDSPAFIPEKTITYNESIVNTTTNGDQVNAYSIGLKDGGWVVAWQSNDGSNDGIYAQLYSSNGLAIGSEFRVNYQASDTQSDVSLAALEDGGFIVTWQSLSKDSSYLQDGSAWSIHAQRYSTYGKAIGGEFVVNSYSYLTQSYPDVTALKDGGFVISWQSINQDGSGYGIYAQRYNQDGSKVGSEFRVNNVTSGDQVYPKITALEDGGFIIAWEVEQDNNIYFKRYYPNGSNDEVKVIEGDSNLYNPKITGLKDGGFVVTWYKYVSGNIYDAFAQRYSNSGQAVGSIFTVNTTTLAEQYNTSVAALKDGGFIISWTSYSKEAGSFSHNIYAQRYGSDGQKLGSEFKVNSYNTSRQDLSSVAALEDGGFVISWQSSDQDGSGYGIYSQRYFADGTKAGSNISTLDIDEDIASLAIAIGASDVDGDVLTYSLKENYLPQKGVVTFNQTDGSYIYTPNSNENGKDSFIILVEDGNGGTNELKVNVDISSKNDLPVLNLSSTTVEKNGSVVVDVLSSAFDADGDNLKIIATSNSLHGVVSIFIAEDGKQKIKYIPNSGYSGNDVFSYTVRDSNGGYVTKNMSVAVSGNNSPVFLESSLATTYVENLVSSGNHQDMSAVIGLKDGGYIVAWQSSDQDGSGYGVYAQRYNSIGGTVGSEFLVNTTTVNHQKLPAIAALQDGGFVVVWESYGGSSVGYTTYGQRYGIDGLKVGSEFKVNYDSSNGDFPFSSVAALSDGGFVVSWKISNQIYFRSYSSDGQPSSYKGINDELTVLGEYNPSIIGLKNGNFAVLCDSSPDSSSKNFFQIFSHDGQAITNATSINEGGQYIAATVLENGNFIATWQSYNDSGFMVYAKIYSADGQTILNQFQIDNSGYYYIEQSSPAITALKDGGFIVSWQESDSSSSGVYAQRYSDAGLKIGSKFRINTTTIDVQERPSIAALEDGGFIVTWQSYGSSYGIYSQRYNSDGSVVKTAYTASSTASSSKLVNEDNSFSETIAAVDNDGDILTYSLKENYLPSKGTVTFNQVNKTYTYTPYQNQNGNDSFVVLISDDKGGTAELSVSVVVNAINDAPIANLIVATTDEDASKVIDVLSQASDIDGDVLTILSVTQGVNGAATIFTDIDGKQKIKYNPNANYNGSDVITYTISDNKGGNVTKELVVNINSVNDAPTIQSQIISQIIKTTETLSYQIPSNLFSDIDGDTLTYSATLTDGSSLPSWLSFDGSKFSGTPTNSDIGVLAISLTATDPFGASVLQSFNIAVESINQNVSGTGGDDVIETGIGNDVISSGGGDDAIYAGDGNDNIYGDDGADIMEGEGGNDKLDGGSGNDIISGGEGDDEISGGDGNDIITGGSDKNNSNNIRNNYLANILSYSDNDLINGNAGNDEIYAGDGNDVVNGGSGDDKINGGAGNDDLTGGGGNDITHGDEGDDVIYGALGDDELYGDAGNDKIVGSDGNEKAYGGDGDDVILGNIGTDELHGGMGKDLINGNQNNDIIFGDVDDDTLDGNQGDDIVYGGDGADNIRGSNGRDKLFGDAGNDWMSGGADDDELHGGEGNDFLEGAVGNDLLFGGDGDDTICGNDGNDVIDGGAGNDIILGHYGSELIHGGNGDDNIEGNQDNDILHGDEGNDRIRGGIGDDTLIGGLGVDTLIGAVGRDVFVFENLDDSTSSASDLILDFIQGEDKINVSAFGFSEISKGLGSNVSGNGLEYHFEGNETIVKDIDSNFSFKLNGNINLNYDDFNF